jgi:adenine-specific DNA-methyltransferase
MGSTLLFRRYLDDYPYSSLNALWLDTQMGGFAAKDKIYVVQTNISVIQRCLLMTTDPATWCWPRLRQRYTAYVAEQWGGAGSPAHQPGGPGHGAHALMAAPLPLLPAGDSPEGVGRRPG